MCVYVNCLVHTIGMFKHPYLLSFVILMKSGLKRASYLSLKIYTWIDWTQLTFESMLLMTKMKKKNNIWATSPIKGWIPLIIQVHMDVPRAVGQHLLNVLVPGYQKIGVSLFCVCLDSFRCFSIIYFLFSTDPQNSAVGRKNPYRFNHKLCISNLPKPDKLGSSA